jgi:hypothetical protein
MNNNDFSELFTPEEDPNFPYYKEHLLTILNILEPFIRNKISDEEEVLKEIRSMLACFAMYVFKEAELKMNTVLN